MSATRRLSAREKGRPTVPIDGGLAVIGAGFGRTGTSSIQEALDIIGYGPVYHMVEVFKDPEGIAKWEKVGLCTVNKEKQSPELWDDIFWGYKSTVDFPAANYYEDLMEQYPNAKVILSVRDEEKWFESVKNTIAPASPLWTFLYKATFLYNHRFNKMTHHTVWYPLVGNRLQDTRNKDVMIEAFRKHNAQVQATVPKERLLVFNVKEGWKPLCEFLNCPIPEQDFPHVNDTAQFQKIVTARRRKCVMRLVLGATALAAATGVTLFLGGGLKQKDGSTK